MAVGGITLPAMMTVTVEIAPTAIFAGATSACRNTATWVVLTIPPAGPTARATTANKPLVRLRKSAWEKGFASEGAVHGGQTESKA